MIKENKDIVKRQLWSNGYSAKDVSHCTDYDLLVDNKIKVEVKSTIYNQKGNYWLLNINKKSKTKKADVLAIIIPTVLDEDVIYYMDIKKNFKNLGAGKLKINSEIIKTLFTVSLTKIFK